MLNIALFPNTLKSQAKAMAIEIVGFLTKREVAVYAEDDEAEEFKAKKLSQIAPNSIDFMISLGGDGTILRLIHKHPEITAPLLGINLGGLGFMADIPSQEIHDSLQKLLDGHYTLSQRITMESVSTSGERQFAVNEIVIHRAQNPSLVDLAIQVGAFRSTHSLLMVSSLPPPQDPQPILFQQADPF